MMTQEQQRIVNLETRFAELASAYQALALSVEFLYRVVEVEKNAIETTVH